MKVTLEISHYPLADEYEKDIIDFIDQVKSIPDLEVYTNAMSTYIKGEWKLVSETLYSGLNKIWNEGSNTSSTVIKIIPRDLPVEVGFIKL